MGSKTLRSACYILSVESSILFYSTSNGYKNLYFPAKINLLCAGIRIISIFNPISKFLSPYSFPGLRVYTDEWTDGNEYIDSASDLDPETALSR